MNCLLPLSVRGDSGCLSNNAGITRRGGGVGEARAGSLNWKTGAGCGLAKGGGYRPAG